MNFSRLSRTKQVAATMLTVSAAKPYDCDRQRRTRLDKIAFAAAWENPRAEDVASLGQLVNMPSAPLATTAWKPWL